MIPALTDSVHCVHRWRVATPRPGPEGRLMPALCVRCGAEREYDRAPEPLRLRGARTRRFNPALGPRRSG